MQNNKYLVSFNKQILDCIIYWHKWLPPALNDVNSKYKRTYLGVIWNILATLITLSIMAFVWSYVFKVEMKNFFPYILNGFVIFFFFNTTTMASCQLLTNTYKEIYQNIPISLLNLIMRNFTMNFILYTHFFVIIFPLYFYLYDFKLLNILLYFFGLVLFSINTILISYLCCMITTRYRDFYPLIQAILSAATLLTPIIWNKEMLGSKMEYVYLNPLSFMIEIVRDPIIDKIPDFKVYIYNFSLILVLYLLLITVIKLKGKRIIFWI